MMCRRVFQRIWIFLPLALLVSVDNRPARAADHLFGQRICAPSKMNPRLKAAVADLKSHLERISGVEFSISDELPDAAIVLALSDSSTVPAAALERLPADSTEACCVYRENDQRLWLVARSEMGLSHAIFFYLEHLGCRWYFPAEHWTFVPNRKDLRPHEDLAARPAFRSRAFSGSGGFGGSLPLDPTRELQARWDDWQRRNRFGGEFRIAGHSGEAFNMKHKEALEAHPEWRAMVGGERVPWTIISKFCAGNPEVVELYVQDRLEYYRGLRKNYPGEPHAWGVSVEPADGGGHCSAPESLALGTVSDRVFHVANQVAKAVRREFPDGHVTLFAYNEHAGVPNIPLEENVYVQVIPYAFQRTGLTPDQLLDAWSKKVSRMGIYDYWSIPDWTHDLPDFDPLVFGPERMRGWHRRGVDSFLCESTYSSGAMGLAWYIGARLAWTPETGVEDLFTTFLQDCFGPAAPPMRRLFERWSQGYYPTSHELALTFRDLAEALELAADDAAIARRIADFGRYAHYLRLRFEYLRAKPGAPERMAAAERLMRHLWSVYDSTMIHAFRHSQLLARDEKNAGNPALGETFNWQDKTAPGWATISRLSDAQVRDLIAQGVKDFTPQDYAPRKFTGSLTPLPSRLVAEEPSAEEFGPRFSLNNSISFDYQAESPNESFKARITAEIPVRFSVAGPGGSLVADSEIVSQADWRSDWTDVSFTAPEPGLYRLQVVCQKRPLGFQPAATGKLTMPGWTNSQGAPTPRLYYFVPAQCARLAIYTNYISAGPPRFFNPEGTEVEPKLIDDGHLMLVEIPPGQRGKVWSLDRAKCPNGRLEMLNAPQGFAFSPRGLLVPGDALTDAP